MIRTEGLGRTYKSQFYEVKALVEADIHIKKGEMVAVMGSSGSGKTTLLNLIGLIDDPDAGKVYIGGQEVNKKNREKIRLSNISYIFQHFALVDTDSVYENIELPLLAHKVKKSKRKKTIKALLERLGIENLKDQPPTKISGGQKQRVAIARALAADTPIILADEPTGALDSVNASEVMDILRSLSDEDKTIIIVTHDIEVAKKADRIIHIENGRVVS
ncbi:MAG TPA: peptide ABC transporter ATP-binding protein [Eubacterium sp.]|nr:peptide ABC transporter ATP-binding protein [Eubacterium sp.]